MIEKRTIRPEDGVAEHTHLQEGEPADGYAPTSKMKGLEIPMWYVIQVQSGTEEKIRQQCERTISPDILTRCYIPYYERMRRYEGAWHKEQKILLPGYLFLVSDRLEELYLNLKHVIGLTKLIGTGRQVVPLTESEIELLRKLGNDTELIEMSQGIIEGKKTVILSGPLQGMEGCIRKIDRHKRIAYLEIEMMGRLVDTQVGLEILAKEESVC